ncbi:hypothetical protein [Glaciihabitans sp. dw_435]|uniref:hypothetical protein n=1 Tax=Glaciihabitans sp. dw_435 TaxID=2720081 RepID=UPI001BD38A59|nr:hypothetical protein [Glaciihabitans sp. dw_435]
MKKLTTIITATVAGAALVLGAATAASAYPVGIDPVISVKTTGLVASSVVPVKLNNVQSGAIVQYAVDGRVVANGVGGKTATFRAPGLAGEYTLAARIRSGVETDRTLVTEITVGKIVAGLSAKATASTVKKNAKATITGAAVTAPRSTGFVVVKVQVRTAKTAYQTIKTIRTESNGKYSYSFKLGKGTYAVRIITGDAQFSGAVSNATQVTFK